MLGYLQATVTKSEKIIADLQALRDISFLSKKGEDVDQILNRRRIELEKKIAELQELNTRILSNKVNWQILERLTEFVHDFTAKPSDVDEALTFHEHVKLICKIGKASLPKVRKRETLLTNLKTIRWLAHAAIEKLESGNLLCPQCGQADHYKEKCKGESNASKN